MLPAWLVPLPQSSSGSFKQSSWCLYPTSKLQDMLNKVRDMWQEKIAIKGTETVQKRQTKL